jgi:hypothetical protein
MCPSCPGFSLSMGLDATLLPQGDLARLIHPVRLRPVQISPTQRLRGGREGAGIRSSARYVLC